MKPSVVITLFVDVVLDLIEHRQLVAFLHSVQNVMHNVLVNYDTYTRSRRGSLVLVNL